MAYKALYRTYRPQFFREVVGQEVVVKTLQNAIASKKVSHAYLFSGPRGTGKTTLARIFAKTLNCSNVTLNEPCNNCPSCHEISDGVGIDVIEIDAASNNGVDEIREIREKVKFLPAGAKYKIYIIDEVHMLSTGAFNALLKTLEEPPKHVVFILATTEPHKLPATIISRCQRFDFKSLTINEITHKLRQVCAEENIEIDEEALKSISESAEGGLRDGLSILDQAISYADEKISIDEVNLVTGNINNDRLIELGLHLHNKDTNKVLEIINELIDSGKEVGRLVNNIIQFFRDMLLFKSVDSVVFTKYIFEKSQFKFLTEKTDLIHIFYYIDVLSDVQSKIKYSQSPRIYLEVAFIRLINVSNEDLNYIAKIKELEEKINNLDLNKSSDVSNTNSFHNEKDNERIEMLELKLNKIVSELNRLNLQENIEKINNLQNKVENNYDKDFIKINSEVEEIKKILSEVKENNQVTDEIQNIVENNFDEDFLKINKQIEEIIKSISDIKNAQNEKVLNPIQTSPQIIFDESKLDELRIEIIRIKEDLDKIKVEISKIDNKRFDVYPNDLLQKISQIEKQVYDLLSRDLAKKSISEKKKQSGQVALFDSDLTPIKDFEVKKIEVDFMGLEKNDEVKHEEIDKSSDFDEEITEFTEEVKVEEPTSGVTELQSKRTANSELVVTKKEERLFEKERQLMEEEIKKIDPNFPLDKTTEEVNDKDSHFDKFSSYDIRVIEEILHESRKDESRNDFKRIGQMWKNIVNLARPDQKGTAEILKDCRVAAVGNKELILVYKTAALCNQVMRPKFKIDAIKLLKGALNDNYNYVALPEYVWEQKRSEYVEQYQMGTKFPKLKPIEDKDLIIISAKKEYKDPREEIVDKTISFFGEHLINIE